MKTVKQVRRIILLSPFDSGNEKQNLETILKDWEKEIREDERKKHTPKSDKSKPRWYCDRYIEGADGKQTFSAEAKTRDEAKLKFEKGECEIATNECEVTDLSEWDWGTLYYG